MANNPKKDKSQEQQDGQTDRGRAAQQQTHAGEGGAAAPQSIEAGRRYDEVVPGRGGLPVELQSGSRVTIEGPPPPDVAADPAAALNAIILARTSAMRFVNYEQFIEDVFCSTRFEGDDENRLQQVGPALAKTRVHVNRFSNLYAYELLKVATEAFLALQCTDIIRQRPDTDPKNPGSYEIAPPGLPGYERTSLARGGNTPDDIRDALFTYLGTNRTLPYIDAIALPLVRVVETMRSSPALCDVSPFGRFSPCWIELIWSYWHEEGMLVQTINAISLRFQNRRSRANGGRDPLAHLELESLRPLNNLLWGYIQDEQSRLTIARRAYEYQHEYGLTLYGKAVPPLKPADTRSKFIEAFHNLLHTASIFYRDQSNKFVIPDAFPLLNALKEVHLLLAEGAHNQFGDMPWTARVEMLIQKWLLSRPEMQRFLGGRFMVPYPENWMGIVDQMKTLQGWTDVSVRYFRDLAVYGEQLLLSIRWGDWGNVDSSATAENWANIHRDAVYGYIHAYRTVTGVDLSVSTNAVRLAAESYMQPSQLLRNRLAAQRRPS